MTKQRRRVTVAIAGLFMAVSACTIYTSVQYVVMLRATSSWAVLTRASTRGLNAVEGPITGGQNNVAVAMYLADRLDSAAPGTANFIRLTPRELQWSLHIAVGNNQCTGIELWPVHAYDEWNSSCTNG